MSKAKFGKKMSEVYGVKGVALVEYSDGTRKIVTLASAKAFDLKIVKTAKTVKELQTGRKCEDCGKQMLIQTVRWCGANAFIWRCACGNIALVNTSEEMKGARYWSQKDDFLMFKRLLFQVRDKALTEENYLNFLAGYFNIIPTPEDLKIPKKGAFTMHR